MVRDLIKVDMLSIDGVSPSNQTLRDGTYLFMSSIYAAIRKTESQDSKAYKLFQFLFTKTGSNMIDESGYIAIRKADGKSAHFPPYIGAYDDVRDFL